LFVSVVELIVGIVMKDYFMANSRNVIIALYVTGCIRWRLLRSRSRILDYLFAR